MQARSKRRLAADARLAVTGSRGRCVKVTHQKSSFRESAIRVSSIVYPLAWFRNAPQPTPFHKPQEHVTDCTYCATICSLRCSANCMKRPWTIGSAGKKSTGTFIRQHPPPARSSISDRQRVAGASVNETEARCCVQALHAAACASLCNESRRHRSDSATPLRAPVSRVRLT